MNNLEWTTDKFLAWEGANRHKLRINKVYIDMAGDLVAGVILSQIVYWHTPDQDGNSKLRVYKHDTYWLVKSDKDWLNECRVTSKQARTAIGLLIDLGIIEKKIMRFNNAPTAHLRIVWNRFFELLESNLPVSVDESKSIPEMPSEGKSDLSQKVKSDITQKGKSYNKELQQNTTNTLTAEPPPPLSEHKNGKKSRPRTMLEIAVITLIFKLPADTELSKGNGFLVGRMHNFLRKHKQTVEDLTAFVQWYDQKFRAALPHDYDKFERHYLAYLNDPSRNNSQLDALLSQL